MEYPLPEIIEFNGTGVKEGDFKIALGKMRMYLDSLLGSDGLPNTANTKLGTARNSVLSKTADYTATATDKGKVIRFTGDTELTLSFSEAMSLGNGWSMSIINDSTANLTIDPYSGELIDGVTTFTVKAGGRIEIVCDGVRFFKAGVVGDSQETGSVIIMASNITPSGYLPCNGAVVSIAAYPELYTAIGTKYGAGDGSTTFNLPDYRNKWICGSDVAGSVLEAGLPNITGSFEDASGNPYTPKGAFYSSRFGSLQGVENSGYYTRFYIDASRSNPIYGKSSTVQPPSMTARLCIKY